MKLIHFLLVLILISAVSGATIKNSISAQGEGTVMRHLGYTWEAGSGGLSVEGAAGGKILTSPGVFQYQTKDTLDATINNRYNGTGYSGFENTGVFNEYVSMEESDLGQRVAVEHGGILTNAQIDTAKFISDANISMGQQAEWSGSGVYTRDISYNVDILQSDEMDVYNVGEPSINYEATGFDKFRVYTNETMGAIVKPQFEFTDFSDAFVLNTSSIPEYNVTNATNVTVNGT